MISHFAPYEGKNPYIFMSYAHADAGKVLPIIKELHDRRYRVWYDTGIEAGANWPEVIAGHLSAASYVLFFISENFLKSQNCAREVNFAVDMKLPMVVLSLDNAELPPGMRMQLSQSVSVKAHGTEAPNIAADALISAGAFPENLIGDGVEGYNIKKVKRRRRLNAGIIIGALGIIAAIGAVISSIGISQGWFGRGITKTTVAVSGNASEEEKVLEITTWTNTIIRDLLISQSASEALYICGNAFVTSRSAISYSDGQFLVAGKAVSQGDIDDVKLIADKAELVELALCFQNITDISGLENLEKLQYLDLSGNDIGDLSQLSGMNNLKTLKICHTNVKDLEFVLKIPVLEKLYISFDMIDYAQNILSGNFEVVVTE